MRARLNFLMGLVLCVLASPALASQPGQPLDCSDWIILEAGLSCTVAIAPDCSGQSACIRGVPITTDNSGRLLYIRGEVPIGRCDNGGYLDLYRTSIVARNLNAPGETLIAYVDDRCSPTGNSTDSLQANEQQETVDTPIIKNPIVLDPASGRVLVPVRSYCRNAGGGCPAGGGAWLLAFNGFATTFDVLQTYTPPPTQLSFHVPYMPEGLGGADHFDTYWGPLTKPIDFTQAHPLQCAYPATPPHVGDYETVSDTLPTPGPDSGYYYVTATTYQGQTRYGRKTTGGKLSGRDPALLPVCVLP
jgi:hypothetical protein